jgi:hypothetical protein
MRNRIFAVRGQTFVDHQRIQSSRQTTLGDHSQPFAGGLPASRLFVLVVLVAMVLLPMRLLIIMDPPTPTTFVALRRSVVDPPLVVPDEEGVCLP